MSQRFYLNNWQTRRWAWTWDHAKTIMRRFGGRPHGAAPTDQKDFAGTDRYAYPKNPGYGWTRRWAWTRRCASLLLVLLLAIPVLGQDSGVTAEAVGQANLRETTDVNSALVGQIAAGTRYPVIGRSQFYPWVLLGEPGGGQIKGWVYVDLVQIYGDINQVPFSQVVAGSAPTATFTSATTVIALTATLPPDMTLNGVSLPTSTPTPGSGVSGLVTGEINIRFGPGVEYPRIGVGKTGDRFEVVARHSQLPWLEIRYSDAPNGVGWVANDLLEIEGDVFSLPIITQTNFNLPTLTPTQSVVLPSAPLEGTPVPISPAFAALGGQLWQMRLDGGFDPATSKMGALFLLDLQTGEALSFENQVAFSGMSINKIAILTTLYGQLNAPPDISLATTIADTMICSENTRTNEMLSVIGGGDGYQGAQNVTQFMQDLGMSNSFIVTPYLIDPNHVPTPPFAIVPPETQADKASAEPDSWNQMTVSDMGWLLGEMYQCAYNQSGRLMDVFPGSYTPQECRQMITVMTHNHIGALIEAGVPLGTPVAHKHGWIPDTHGDAGLVMTPGGNYVLVVALHNPTWLDFSESFPVVAEISRTVYNYYNPTAPLAATHQEAVPETCDLFGDPLIDDLAAGR
ncbi:MAG: serine hydrolase [Anaerolineae bacterium]|nr:serine hydrolase [Anaerolineae bacterium]